jgi:hypothetical protein
MKTIILNSSNIDAGSNNTQLTYKFPVGGVAFKDEEIAVSQLSIYYSWFNINASLYNNNSYTYTWIDGTTHTITMPDGFYTVSTLNFYLQDQMLQNLHYYTDSGGDIVYFLEWEINVSRYGVQLNAYPVPTPATATSLGYTLPAGATWGALPLVASTPQLTILATNNFKDIVGFNAGTYPPVVQSTNYSKLSDYIPQVSPVNSIVMTCNLINNPLSNPSKLLYSFTPANASFGELITIQPPEYTWNEISNGYYTQITINMLDQNLNPIQILDPQMVILLSIKKKYYPEEASMTGGKGAGF